MNTRVHRIVINAFLAIAVAPSASASDTDYVALQVEVRIAPAVPAGIVRESKSLAADVFRAIGVDVRWTSVDAAETPRGPAPALWRRIVILRSATADFPAAATDSHVLGIAPRSGAQPGHVAYVFYDAISSAARQSNIPQPAMLGYAIAHELGHQLLSGDGHASTGVMRLAWQWADLQQMKRRTLAFDDERAYRIRQFVSVAGEK